MAKPRAPALLVSLMSEASSSGVYAVRPLTKKILDIIGDLALLGIELAGHVVACRSGHPLNVALGQDLWMRAGQAGGYSFRARTQPVEPVLRRAA